MPKSILTTTKIIKKYHTLIIGGLISIVFWVLESLIHLELYMADSIELLPTDINELWMRSLIVVLIMVMSIYAHFSQTRELKIERDKSQLKEQLLDEQYNKMELILSTRKQTQEALENFNKSVLSIRKNIEDGEGISEAELIRLGSIINAVQNKLNRLWS